MREWLCLCICRMKARENQNVIMSNDEELFVVCIYENQVSSETQPMVYNAV